MSCALMDDRLRDAARRKSSFLMCIIIDIGLIDKGYFSAKSSAKSTNSSKAGPCFSEKKGFWQFEAKF